MMFYACKCGTVTVWEDERQPSQKTWTNTIQLLKDAGVEVVVFNGSKVTPPGFQGVN